MAVNMDTWLMGYSWRQVLGVLVLLRLLYVLLRPKRAVERLPAPPAPHWIFGHEKVVAMNQPGTMFKKWADSLGLTFRIKAAFGARDILIMCDPAGLSHIMQRKIYDYPHSDIVKPRAGRLLGRGIGWVEGESEHRRMRQMILPSLSHENMKAMSSDVRDSAIEMVDDLSDHLQSNGGGMWLNLIDWTSKATLDIIGRVAFLHDFGGGKSEDAQSILGARRTGASPSVTYANFIILMLLRRFTIINYLPVAAIQGQALARKVIEAGAARELFRRNEQMAKDANLRAQKDLMSKMMVEYEAGRVSMEEVYAQISTLIITGNETTAQTMAYMFRELSRHPEAQDRLREELAAFQGEPNYDDYQNKLPYLDAVIKETLRMYPGLPYMERIATKADVIPLREPVTLSNGKLVSELHVSPGQVVLIPIISIQRLSSVWDDPEEFRPERWLEANASPKRAYTGWGNMMVFSDGPRSCIGMRLALFEMKTIVTHMIRKFRFVDTHEELTFKIASSLLAWVSDKVELGPCIPVRVELL